MDDMISRQAAIDALDEQIRQCDKALSAFDISMKDEYAVKVERASLVAFRETLEYMSSAQPGWIPTSVKPPEPFKLVLIQDYCGCYELNTYIPPRINPKQYPNGYWGEVGTVDFDYFDVEAWCPLPAPYREGGQDG